MSITKIKRGLALVAIGSSALAVGCELIVDFDRTKIPVDVAEASVPDSSVAETGAPPMDGGTGAADSGDADADAAVIDDGAADASDSG